ncbi:MAG: YfhO family protein [Planctomycetota bacterium]|jgi:hypothetical protein
MKKGVLAAFLYLLLAALMVSQAILEDGVGLSADAIYTVKPWDKTGYDGLDSYNPANDYQAFFIYPWMNYTWDHLREGKIPFWTHLVGGGSPYMGNLSCACFYPLNWIGLLVSEKIFWALTGLIKLWLCAMLTFALLRMYNLRFLSALFGGLAFGFSGFMICWMNHPHSNVVLFLPALLIAVEYLIRKRTGFAFLLNAVLLGLQVLGGSPEVSFLLYVTWGLYLAYRIRHEEGLLSSGGISLLAFGLLTGLIGVGLVAFQFLPFLEYLANSYGLETRVQNWGDFLNGGSGRLLSPFGFMLGLIFPLFILATIGFLQRKNTVFVGVWSGLLGGLCLIVALRIGFWLGAKPHLLMQVLPELYGPPRDGCQNVGDISFSALNGGYAGVIAAFLALYTFVAPCKRRPVPFFILLFVFSFGTAHSIPWLTHMLKCVPFLGWAHNANMLCITAFSVAIIAPFGLEDILFRAANIEGRSAAIAGVVGAIFVVAWAILVSSWNFFETGVSLVEAERHPDPSVAITSPAHGSKHNGLEPLIIQGKAAPNVEVVRTMLDNFFVGDKRTEVTEERAPPPNVDYVRIQQRVPGVDRFTRPFEYSYSLDRVDEGTYKISASPYSTHAKIKQPGDDWIDMRVVRPKTVTQKDFLILCISVACFLFLLGRRLPVSLRALLVVIVLAVDLFWFGYGYSGNTPSERLFPPTDVTDFLQQQKKPYRIFTESGIMPPNTNFPYGIEHMEWDDRLGVAGYSRLCSFIRLDVLAKPTEFSIYNFDLQNPLFDLMGLKYVLIRSDVDLTKLLEKFKLVYDGDVRIYENTEAQDRAFVVGDWIRWGEMNESKVLSSDLKNIPVLLEDPPIRKGGRGTAEILEYEDEYVRLSVETQGQGLLVFTDNYFPGWEAYVDGEKTPIFVTTGTFRAVPIASDGKHEVVFRFEPQSFQWGLYIALVSAVIAILFAAIPRLTRSLRRREAEITSFQWPQ